jgi:hypothetical protein
MLFQWGKLEPNRMTWRVDSARIGAEFSIYKGTVTRHLLAKEQLMRHSLYANFQSLQLMEQFISSLIIKLDLQLTQKMEEVSHLPQILLNHLVPLY